MCISLCTTVVHKRAEKNSSDNLPFILQRIIIAEMLSTGGEEIIQYWLYKRDMLPLCTFCRKAFFICCRQFTTSLLNRDISADAFSSCETSWVGGDRLLTGQDTMVRTKLWLECGPMPNVMATLPNIVGALCSMLQSLADAHYKSAVQ